MREVIFYRNLKEKLKQKSKHIGELEIQNRILKAELREERTKLFGRKTKDKKEKPVKGSKKKEAPKGYPAGLG